MERLEISRRSAPLPYELWYRIFAEVIGYNIFHRLLVLKPLQYSSREQNWDAIRSLSQISKIHHKVVSDICVVAFGPFEQDWITNVVEHAKTTIRETSLQGLRQHPISVNTSVAPLMAAYKIVLSTTEGLRRTITGIDQTETSERGQLKPDCDLVRAFELAKRVVPTALAQDLIDDVVYRMQKARMLYTLLHVNLAILRIRFRLHSEANIPNSQERDRIILKIKTDFLTKLDRIINCQHEVQTFLEGLKIFYPKPQLSVSYDEFELYMHPLLDELSDEIVSSPEIQEAVDQIKLLVWRGRQTVESGATF